METIGWLGSLLLAFCGLPQALESIKTKSSAGLTWGFILMWSFGEIFTFIYVAPKMDLPLIFNYTANIIFLAIIVYYKLAPKRK
jgi:uncharacterized protein with PQ loop repeat